MVSVSTRMVLLLRRPFILPRYSWVPKAGKSKNHGKNSKKVKLSGKKVKYTYSKTAVESGVGYMEIYIEIIVIINIIIMINLRIT